jgi:NAD(P)-dependent dehydrogenase (short-subunit alcohol dehydrogenase family)
MTIQIQDTIALVTGANRGIGRALVEALLERGAKKVYATARRPDALDDLVVRFGDRVMPLRLDVARPGEVRAVAAQVSDVRLLINNAGVLAKLGGDFTEPLWLETAREEFEVNVLGAWSLMQAFAPVLGQRPGAAVVNVSSVAGLAGLPAAASYSMSKAALHSLTQIARAALASRGIHVAGVYPGPIDTDMGRSFPIDKTSASDAARGILDGIEAGREEIFPDPMSRQLGELFLRDPKAVERQLNAPSAASVTSG